METTEISGVITQGRGDKDQRVTKYKVGYIEDACSPTVKFIQDGGQPKIFDGNTDRTTAVTNTFTHINAVHLRIYPTENFGWDSLRFEVMTCSASTKTSACTKGGVEDKTIAAGNLIASNSNRKCNNKDRWRLNGEAMEGAAGNEDGYAGCWCPDTNHGYNEYVGVKFDQATEVSGLITQGRHDKDQWVTQFKVAYTETDGGSEEFILDEEGNEKIFTGNSDRTTEVEQYFPCHLNAFSVRIYPTASSTYPSMRFEVVTCT